MGLLDSILGNFTGGGPDGYSPVDALNYGAPDQVSTPPTDPYGNRVGDPATGVPLPRARPPEAGPAAFSPPGVTAPELQPGEPAGADLGLGTSSGLASAFDPDRTKTVMASLAGGLSNVKNSPFAGQVAASAAGSAIAGGNKAEDTAINQALKLEQVRQRALKYADAASAQWYRDRVSALREELRSTNYGPQTAEEKAALRKGLQDRAKALAAEFPNIKLQNRRAQGLVDYGTPLAREVVGGVEGPESGALS